MNRSQLTEKHNFINDTIFRLKSAMLMGNRMMKNLHAPMKKFQVANQLVNEPVVAFSESDLWNPFDNKDNWILTAGKIQNLRIAVRRIHGLEIQANEIFSFWKHIGNPNIGKGYVVGREIREGCIVPTIAGGLCQLSNALYDTALKANFEILERHKHTKVIKGSLAEQDRDATVKWNYIDLRFRSNHSFRIEVELTADKLILSFKSSQKNDNMPDEPLRVRHSNKLNDCYSCGNLACFKHPDRSSVKQTSATTTFILDEKWPEFDEYVKSISSPSDVFILPLKKSHFLKTDRYSWSTAPGQKRIFTQFQGLYRASKLRIVAKGKNNVFELGIELEQKIARAAAKLINPESTHVVISQNLLPFVYEVGALGGRTYDVMMTRLPMELLHERLDKAYALHPTSTTLSDFRASEELRDLENRALTKARKVITPHADIARIFQNKVELLQWIIPKGIEKPKHGTKILFPASSLGRKGAYEMRQIAMEFNLELTIAGSASEADGFWGNVKTDRFDGDLSKIGLIVYPTFIEHQPRLILKAIARAIPVITTSACGLTPSETVRVINPGNIEQLRTAITAFFTNRSDLM